MKSSCTKTRAGNRQFVCNKKFGAIAEQNPDKKTRQDRSAVRVDCESDASMSCGGCEEGCKKDPHLVEILQTVQLKVNRCVEMTSDWTPMPQPLLVDSGAAQTVSHTEDVVSEPQDSGIRRVQARCLLHESRWQHRGPRRRENVDHVNSRWSTIEERGVPSGKRQQCFG